MIVGEATTTLTPTGGGTTIGGRSNMTDKFLARIADEIECTLRHATHPLDANEILSFLRGVGIEAEKAQVYWALCSPPLAARVRRTADGRYEPRGPDAPVPDEESQAGDVGTTMVKGARARAPEPPPRDPPPAPARAKSSLASSELHMTGEVTLTRPAAIASAVSIRQVAELSRVIQTVDVEGRSVRLIDHPTIAPTQLASKRSPPASARPAVYAPGTRLANRYLIMRQIGSGGMGRVYEAVDLQLNRSIAIKTILCREGIDYAALQNEANLLVRIDRPDYFPRVYAPFESDGNLHVPMALIKGIDLKAYLQQTPASQIDVSQVVRIFDAICERLDYLHNFPSGQVLLRDLKPANVMLQEFPFKLWLIDFGIASAFGDAEGPEGGTGLYWAPEARLSGRYSPRSDLFALGRVLHCLLLGTGVLDSENLQPAVRLASQRGIPLAMSSLVARLTEADPERRPSGAREAQDLLHNLVTSGSTLRMTGTDAKGTESAHVCPECETAHERPYYLCSRCGSWMRTPTGRAAPKFADDEGFRASLASVRTRGTAFAHLDGAALLDRLAEIRRVPEFEELTCLPHLDFQPYAYQQEAALRVLRDLNGRAILADEVGLGKTIEAGLVLKEYIVRNRANRILIICPPGLRFQWKEELIEKFRFEGDFRPQTFGNDDKDDTHSIHLIQKSNRIVVIISHNSARTSDRAKALAAVHWDVVVIDEAHKARLPGAGTQGTQLGRLADALSEKHMLLLTATPAQNHLGELFNLVNLIRPGSLAGTEKSFFQMFGGRHGAWEVRNGEILREVLRSVMIRNRRAVVHKAFPRRIAHTLNVHPSADVIRAYKRLIGILQADPKRALVLSTRARQFCTSFLALAGVSLDAELREAVAPVLGTAHPKIKVLVDEMLERLIAAKKVLVFSEFVDSQREIYETLKKAGAGVRWAEGSPADKVRAVKVFRDDPQVQFLVCGKSLSEGYNLQFCGYMVNFDLPWNPQQIEQRIGRIQRIGSKHREVTVFNLKLDGTIEDLVVHYIEQKLGMFTEVFGFVESVLGGFSETQTVESLISAALRRGKFGDYDPGAASEGARAIDRARAEAGGDSASEFDDLLDDLGTFKSPGAG